MNVDMAIYTQLTSNADFINLIGTTGAAPSLLIGDNLSEDYSFTENSPCGLIELAPLRDDDTQLNIREKVYRLRFYGFDVDAVHNLARKASQLLHRWTAETDEGKIITSKSSGASLAPTEDPNLFGRIVTVTLTIAE